MENLLLDTQGGPDEKWFETGALDRFYSLFCSLKNRPFPAYFYSLSSFYKQLHYDS